MILAILSDTHDNIWAFDRAVEAINDADAVIHCGDLCSPFMIPRLAEAASGKPVHIVWGNNDGDKRLLMVQANKTGSVTIHGDFAVIEFGSRKIAINHYPEIGRALAESGIFDLVCYGHDHTAYEGKIGRTTLLNPGEIMGLYGRRTMAFYDTENQTVTSMEIRRDD